MAFPQAPYTVRVSAVTDGGSPVSGASIKLENLTKATSNTKVSSETNSNIAINLSECGDWDVGNQIKVTATYSVKTGSSTHTAASGDNGKWDVGSIAISSDGAVTGVRTDHIDEMSAGASVLLHNLKNHVDATLSGTARVVEIDDNGTPYYFKVYPTKT